MFYNLFTILVRIWRISVQRSIDVDIKMSTQRYPDIQITLYTDPNMPSATFTTEVAGALILNLLQRFANADVKLSYLDAGLWNREGPRRLIGGARAAYVPQSLGSSPSKLLSNTSLFGSYPDLAIDAFNQDVTVHMDFHGRLPCADPRTTWLTAFLSWTGSFLEILPSERHVSPTPPSLEFLHDSFTTSDGFHLISSAVIVNSAPGSLALT